MFISLKLNFSEPLQISSSDTDDVLSIEFPIHQLFAAKSDGFMLEANYTI
jgi:hypothetical protein